TNRFYYAKTGAITWKMHLVNADTVKLVIDEINVDNNTTVHGLNYFPVVATKQNIVTKYQSSGKFELLLKDWLQKGQ
ncbi:MAG TPA: hypothetical protein VGG71_11200, partial [Chitinophagaceae bacterium]